MNSPLGFVDSAFKPRFGCELEASLLEMPVVGSSDF